MIPLYSVLNFTILFIHMVFTLRMVGFLFEAHSIQHIHINVLCGDIRPQLSVQVSLLIKARIFGTMTLKTYSTVKKFTVFSAYKFLEQSQSFSLLYRDFVHTTSFDCFRFLESFILPSLECLSHHLLFLFDFRRCPSQVEVAYISQFRILLKGKLRLICIIIPQSQL